MRKSKSADEVPDLGWLGGLLIFGSAMMTLGGIGVIAARLYAGVL